MSKALFMKAFIKESFMQNPEALAKLEETGDATLTHTQDKGIWGQLFPNILMQVREELRGVTTEPVVDSNTTDTKEHTVVNQLINHLIEQNIPVFGRDAMAEFLKTHKLENQQQAILEQKEMDTIKQKAIADGIFMKAPNGNATNLSERQWLQVRTTNFKKWFGDWENNPSEASKVVDENGEPLVVYHGGAKGNRVFHPSTSEESTTGYGTYKDNRTGEEIPVDSTRTMFFSTNPFVAKSYQTLYAINVLSKLEGDINSLLETSGASDGISVSQDRFKTLDNYFKTLETLSEFNPRFTKLSNWLKEIRAKGQHPSAREVEAYRQMLADVKKSIEPLTEQWLMNRSSWENVSTSFKNILDKYNNSEGIRKLKQGEIPSEILKEFSIYKKIEEQRKKEGLSEVENYKEVSVSTYTKELSAPYFAFEYDGKTLTVRLEDGSSVDIKSLSEHQISELFKAYKVANDKSFKLLNEDETYSTLLRRGEVYPVFLNIKTPLEHDYEGTMQGSGYKQSKKYSFGYVASRQVNKAIKDGKDGVVYKNLYDPYLADNYGVFNANQIKSATDNNGNFSLTDDNIQAAWGKKREIYNSDLEKQEINAIQKHIETLSKETDTSSGLWHIVSYTRGVNKGKTFAYRFNTSLHQYEQNRKDKHDGFEILEKVDVSTLSEEQLKELENGIKENKTGFNSWLKRAGYEKRSNDGGDVLVKNGETVDNHDGLDSYSLSEESDGGQSNRDSKSNQGESEITKFQTSQGEVYGFVDKDGNIYLDETKISPEHPIHEYTHLWDRAVQKHNPTLWNKGVELMKQTSLWNDILNSEQYGKQWQAMGISQEKMDNLIASEVHARLTGVEGAEILSKLANEKGQAGIIGKLKQWILDVWKDLKSTFGNWSKEDLDKLTLEDFKHMAIRDFTEGTDLNKMESTKDNSQGMSEESLPPIDTTSLAEDKIPEANPEGPLKDFSLHSGGEKGADYTWGNIGAEYGVAGKHYYDAIRWSWSLRCSATLTGVAMVWAAPPTGRSLLREVISHSDTHCHR